MGFLETLIFCLLQGGDEVGLEEDGSARLGFVQLNSGSTSFNTTLNLTGRVDNFPTRIQFFCMVSNVATSCRAHNCITLSRVSNLLLCIGYPMLLFCVGYLIFLLCVG